MLTEEQIEDRVMRFFDRLDIRFMSGAISQEQYDAGVRDIDGWSEVAYRMLRRSEALD
jgi:hypothetical protein